jgi:hypothetical protein
MKMLLWPGPKLAEVTLGVYFCKSSKVWTLSCFSVSPVSAWIVMGTSCAFSTRRCAVTVISWISSEDVSAAAVSVPLAVAACANPPVVPLNMAAIA